MRKFKRMIARANMKRAGYTRLNKKSGDGRSTFAKLWNIDISIKFVHTYLFLLSRQLLNNQPDGRTYQFLLAFYFLSPS